MHPASSVTLSSPMAVNLTIPSNYTLGLPGNSSYTTLRGRHGYNNGDNDTLTTDIPLPPSSSAVNSYVSTKRVKLQKHPKSAADAMFQQVFVPPLTTATTTATAITATTKTTTRTMESHVKPTRQKVTHQPSTTQSFSWSFRESVHYVHKITDHRPKTLAITISLALVGLMIFVIIFKCRRSCRCRMRTYNGKTAIQDNYGYLYEPIASSLLDDEYDYTFVGVSIPLLQETTRI